MISPLPPNRVILGTPASPVAMAQAAQVAGLLEEVHPHLAVHYADLAVGAAEPAPSRRGSARTDLHRLGQLALTEYRVDFTVSSGKDMPAEGEQDPDLTVAAVLDRDDPRDALVLPTGQAALTLAELPRGAVVGTSSARRTAQLHTAAPHLTVRPLAGHLGERLEQLDARTQGLDALLVSHHALRVLDLDDRAAQVLDTETFLPATGAGFLVVQCRSDDVSVRSLFHQLDRPAALQLWRIERRVKQALGATCRTSCAVHATWDISNTHIRVAASILATGDAKPTRATVSAPAQDEAALIDELVQRLRGNGADALRT
ncbi:hydroxymethylbilane synthase [Streptomyces sp. NPDC050085]|uniref:hydroxymethylbilane synthase n=1 Tax=Streptomyces sp. NPDC050085 TaxID=3365600 RepID=UPI0037AC60F5